LATPNRLTRDDLIGVLRGFGEDSVWTSRDLCEATDLPHYQIRGALGWCLAEGIVVRAGKVSRRDKSGAYYQVFTYRWTGVQRARSRRRPKEVMDAVNRWLRGVLI